MAVVGTFATELKTCVMKLRRIGDAESETIEIQRRATVPAPGEVEVIEVSVGEATVRARVTHVSGTNDCFPRFPTSESPEPAGLARFGDGGRDATLASPRSGSRTDRYI